MTAKSFRNFLLFFLCAAGVYALGHYIGRLAERRTLRGGNLERVIKLIETAYVDSVDIESLENSAIPMLLGQLDPHTAFLTKDENISEAERLDGSFSGIGVQFNTLLDTPVVIKVIPGGPSERAGVKAGDRMLRADGKPLFGKTITEDKMILNLLRGAKRSVVKLDLLRDGKPVTAKVVRDDVPVPTVETAFMASPDVLYIRLNGWGLHTQGEVLAAFAQNASKVKGMILDLRDNGGGYLDAATLLGSEFLPEKRLVLYAEGKAFPRREIITDHDGLLKDLPLVVLQNEFSASSSEIFTGAMQDHDRALVIGRRSFGKGLVQSPYMMPDSSVIRLTVARYYTPSGRCIQKPYNQENEENYLMDIQERYIHGELYNADSMRINDTVQYHTHSGRIVYGGGGIIPDVFIPRDTSGITSYYLRLAESGAMQKYAFIYADANRKWLSKAQTVDELIGLLDARGVVHSMAAYAQSREGVQIRTMLFNRSYELIRTNLYALIADYFFDREGVYRVLMKSDQAMLEAVNAINKGQTYPISKLQKINKKS